MSNALGGGGPRLLDDQLVSIYKGDRMIKIVPAPPVGHPTHVQEFLKPIESGLPNKTLLMRNGVPAANLAAVQDIMVNRLLTIIAQSKAGNGADSNALFTDVPVGGQTIAGIMTIRQFMKLSAINQLSVIDTGWKRVCEKKAYDKLSSEMLEPLTMVVDPTGTPVPSGAIPGAGTSLVSGFSDITPQGRRPNAFTGLGVGFRVDGSGTDEKCQESIDRVLRDGMTTQLKNRYLMRNIKGWEVEGTTVDLDTNAPRVWRVKDDLFNESAVCVARNLYGATAFPMRDLVGQAVLWCVDVQELLGFDTEKHQTTLAGNRQWRPGEKAYKKIPKGNVIGYVKFDKLGCDAAGGWRFRIAADATWTFVNGWDRLTSTRSAAVMTYVKQQLNAWRGPQRDIAGAYDFAS